MHYGHDNKKYLRKSPNTIAYIAQKGYNGKQGEWTFFNFGIWYILIVMLTIGFISQSVGIYTNYTTRECLDENCPLVVGELGTVLLCDLTIFMLGLVLLWMVYKTNLHYGRVKTKRKQH